MKPICSICQSELLDDDTDQYAEDAVVIRVSPCGHVYHRHCIQELHDYHDRSRRKHERLSCPICRQPIVAEEGDLQWEPIFLSAEDECHSQGRPKKHAALTDSVKAILGLAKELKEESRDAFIMQRGISTERSLAKACREGVFQQLADWSERLKVRFSNIQDAEAVSLLADNLQEWLTLSAGIIEACEQTKKLPDLIEGYRTRLSKLQAIVKAHESEMQALARQHQRQLADTAARYRQNEVAAARSHKDNEVKLKADLEKEIQIWRTKFQTAQESGNNAAAALQEQQQRRAALEELLDKSKNDENMSKARAQKLQQKLAKKCDENACMQQQIQAYEKQIGDLKAEKQISERRMREIAESHSARRRYSSHAYDDHETFPESTANTSITGTYAQDADEFLAVDSPTLNTPSRRPRVTHPTFRVIPAKESRQRSRTLENSKIVAPDSDEEGTIEPIPAERHFIKPYEVKVGHARNPFAKSTSNNVHVSNHPTLESGHHSRQIHPLMSKSRLLPHVQPHIIDLASSDPPSGLESEAIPPSAQKRMRSGPSEDYVDRTKVRLVGGKRHLKPPVVFKMPTVQQKAAAVLGTRASGPKQTRRAVT